MTSLIPWRRTLPQRRNPEAGFPSLLADVDRLFEDLWQHFGQTPASVERDPFAFAPSLDVRDADGFVEVSADLPGLSEKDFEVVAENGVLTIRGERRHEDEREDGGRRWTERSYGRFQRSVRLPEEVDVAKAEASYRNGVLTVRVPKTQVPSKTLKIAVQSA